jgi:DNA-binding transcriptional LysR family regulator
MPRSLLPFVPHIQLPKFGCVRQAQWMQQPVAPNAMSAGASVIFCGHARRGQNLLVALDALLSEGSVTGAARRLGLSSSAMSRTLARLRSATGDPLLVRAGRGLVPTPRAAELRDRVHSLTRDAQAVLRPAAATDLDIGSLDLTFTIRANEGFIELFAAPLVAAITKAAPRVRLRFAPKPDKDARPLREGLIDLEIGVLGESAPEARTRLLFRDGFVGVARTGHSLLTGRKITPTQHGDRGVSK